MKYLVYTIAFLFCQCITGQEVFNEELIFLGAYNDNDQVRVFSNDAIQYTPKKDLNQTSQYSVQQLLDILDLHRLYFVASGEEPLWEFKLNQSELCFSINETEVEFDIEIQVDKQSGFNFMFQSGDNRAFGLIRRIDYKLNIQDCCLLGLSNDYRVYETFISVDGKVYKGCAAIDLE